MGIKIKRYFNPETGEEIIRSGAKRTKTTPEQRYRREGEVAARQAELATKREREIEKAAKKKEVEIDGAPVRVGSFVKIKSTKGNEIAYEVTDIKKGIDGLSRLILKSTDGKISTYKDVKTLRENPDLLKILGTSPTDTEAARKEHPADIDIDTDIEIDDTEFLSSQTTNPDRPKAEIFATSAQIPWEEGGSSLDTKIDAAFTDTQTPQTEGEETEAEKLLAQISKGDYTIPRSVGGKMRQVPKELIHKIQRGLEEDELLEKVIGVNTLDEESEPLKKEEEAPKLQPHIQYEYTNNPTILVEKNIQTEAEEQERQEKEMAMAQANFLRKKPRQSRWKKIGAWAAGLAAATAAVFAISGKDRRNESSELPETPAETQTHNSTTPESQYSNVMEFSNQEVERITTPNATANIPPLADAMVFDVKDAEPIVSPSNEINPTQIETAVREVRRLLEDAIDQSKPPTTEELIEEVAAAVVENVGTNNEEVAESILSSIYDNIVSFSQNLNREQLGQVVRDMQETTGNLRAAFNDRTESSVTRQATTNRHRTEVRTGVESDAVQRALTLIKERRSSQERAVTAPQSAAVQIALSDLKARHAEHGEDGHREVVNRAITEIRGTNTATSVENTAQDIIGQEYTQDIDDEEIELDESDMEDVQPLPTIATTATPPPIPEQPSMTRHNSHRDTIRYINDTGLTLEKIQQQYPNGLTHLRPDQVRELRRDLRANSPSLMDWVRINRQLDTLLRGE